MWHVMVQVVRGYRKNISSGSVSGIELRSRNAGYLTVSAVLPGWQARSRCPRVKPPARRGSPGAGRRPDGGTARSGQVPNSAAVMAGEVRPSRAGPTLAAPMTRPSRGHMAGLA